MWFNPSHEVHASHTVRALLVPLVLLYSFSSAMPHHLLQSRSCSHTLSHHPKSKGSPINVVGSSVAFVDSSRLNKLARAAATAAIISLSTAAACGATCLPAEGPLSAAAVQVSVQVKGGSSADLAGLGPSPTLFLTARPANYKVPYASSKVNDCCMLSMTGLMHQHMFAVPSHLCGC